MTFSALTYEIFRHFFVKYVKKMLWGNINNCFKYFYTTFLPEFNCNLYKFIFFFYDHGYVYFNEQNQNEVIIIRRWN